MTDSTPLDTYDQYTLESARQLAAAGPKSWQPEDVAFRLGQVAMKLEFLIRLVDRLADRLQAADSTTEDGQDDAHRDVQAALDRIAAWAPDTGRRVRNALAGGVPQPAVIAREMLTAVWLPEELEVDRSTVLTALGVVAEDAPAVTS